MWIYFINSFLKNNIFMHILKDRIKQFNFIIIYFPLLSIWYYFQLLFLYTKYIYD